MCVCIFAVTNEDWRKALPFSSANEQREKEKQICSDTSSVVLSFFESFDGWSWSIIQKLVKVVTRDEDSKSKINYPAAASEFSSMSYHEGAPCAKFSMGNMLFKKLLISTLHGELSASDRQVNGGLWGICFSTGAASWVCPLLCTWTFFPS